MQCGDAERAGELRVEVRGIEAHDPFPLSLGDLILPDEERIDVDPMLVLVDLVPTLVRRAAHRKSTSRQEHQHDSRLGSEIELAAVGIAGGLASARDVPELPEVGPWVSLQRYQSNLG